MNNIKIAKQLIKLAKSMIAYGDEESQINDIINSDLKNNPVMAINQIEQVLDDDEFSSLVKQVKSASMRIAYIDDLGILNKIQDKIEEAKTFGEKLIKFCNGKPKYIIAAVGAVFYAYLYTNFLKMMGIMDATAQLIKNPSDGFQTAKYVLNSMEQLIGIFFNVANIFSTFTVYHMIKSLIQNLVDANNELENKIEQEQK